MKKSIAFILPYFGKFNNYFPLFLDSCRYNEDITWLIFTDNQDVYDYPDNVCVTHITFEKLKEHIQKFYDFPVALDTPYELCDLKTAYGEIFEEQLRGYDFWGFCDCDLIFGCIRKFLTDELLEQYDKIFMRGHCTLFRNTPEINRLYRNPIDGINRYKECFIEKGAHHFDEGCPDVVPGINRIFQDAGKNIYDDYLFADIEVESWAFCQADLKNTLEEQQKSRNSVWAWVKGHLFRYYLEQGKIEKEEYLYIHLQKRKMKNKLVGSKNTAFLIYPNEFGEWKMPDERNIQHYNRKRIYFSRLYIRVKEAVRRRKEKFFH